MGDVLVNAPEDQRLNLAGAVRDPLGKLEVGKYMDLKAHFAGEAARAQHPDPKRPGVKADEFDSVEGLLRNWSDPRGQGWIASHPTLSSKTKWFSVSKCGTWRLAFLLARLQRDCWQADVDDPRVEVRELGENMGGAVGRGCGPRKPGVRRKKNDDEEADEAAAGEAEEQPAPKVGRGRGRRQKPDEEPEQPEEAKRGPRRRSQEEVNEDLKLVMEAEQSEDLPRRGRGRPPKREVDQNLKMVNEAERSEGLLGRGRGRPPKRPKTSIEEDREIMNTLLAQGQVPASCSTTIESPETIRPVELSDDAEALKRMAETPKRRLVGKQNKEDYAVDFPSISSSSSSKQPELKWEDFTPQLQDIDSERCFARTWNEGRGGQCQSMRGVGVDLCEEHLKEAEREDGLQYGHCDGPIPAAGMAAFLKAYAARDKAADSPDGKTAGPTRRAAIDAMTAAAKRARLQLQQSGSSSSSSLDKDVALARVIDAAIDRQREEMDAGLGQLLEAGGTEKPGWMQDAVAAMSNVQAPNARMGLLKAMRRAVTRGSERTMEFIAAGGMSAITVWLQYALTSSPEVLEHDRVALESIKFLTLVPITVQLLKESRIGVVLNKLAKRHSGLSRETASGLVDHWKKACIEEQERAKGAPVPKLKKVMQAAAASRARAMESTLRPADPARTAAKATSLLALPAPNLLEEEAEETPEATPEKDDEEMTLEAEQDMLQELSADMDDEEELFGKDDTDDSVEDEELVSADDAILHTLDRSFSLLQPSSTVAPVEADVPANEQQSPATDEVLQENVPAADSVSEVLRNFADSATTSSSNSSKHSAERSPGERRRNRETERVLRELLNLGEVLASSSSSQTRAEASPDSQTQDLEPVEGRVNDLGDVH